VRALRFWRHREHQVGGDYQAGSCQGEGGVEIEAQVFESRKTRKLPMMVARLRIAFELAQALAGFALCRQLHADGGGDGHEEVLAQAVNEQAEYQGRIGGGSKTDQHRPGSPQQQRHHPRRRLHREPQRCRSKYHQEPGQLAR